MARKAPTAAQTPAKPRKRTNRPKPAQASQTTPDEGSTAKDSQFHLRSQAAVARAFQVERSTVHGWIAKGMPGTDGNYNYCHITRWLLSRGPWRSQKYIDALIENAITRD